MDETNSEIERESLHSASDRTLYSLVAESDRKIEGNLLRLKGRYILKTIAESHFTKILHNIIESKGWKKSKIMNEPNCSRSLWNSGSRNSFVHSEHNFSNGKTINRSNIQEVCTIANQTNSTDIIIATSGKFTQQTIISNDQRKNYSGETLNIELWDQLKISNLIDKLAIYSYKEITGPANSYIINKLDLLSDLPKEI